MEQIELKVVSALIKHGELHVRALAKIANEPHANISRAMKSMLNKNIVDFKIEGKNKVFRLKKGIETMNYAHMAEHLKVLELFQKYPFLSIICEQILSRTNEKLIIIFGSFAKLSANKDSDIDVYIETNDRKIKRAIELIDSRLSVKIGKFDKTNLLIKEIIKDHAIIAGIEYYYGKNKIFD